MRSRSPDAAVQGALMASVRLRLISSFRSAVAIAQSFFAWWIGELAGMVPGNLKERFSRPILLVQLNADVVELFLIQGSRTQLLYRGPLEVQSVRDALLKTRRAGWIACLQLNPQDALVRPIELPLAAGNRVGDVLAFELTRQTPFSAEEVYFGWSGSDVAHGGVQTRLAVAEKTLVQEAINRLNAFGIRIDMVRTFHSNPAEGIQLGYKPEIPVTERLLRLASPALITAAVVLAVALVHIEVARREQVLATLQGQVARERKGAIEIENLKSELTGLARQQQFVSEKFSAKYMSDSVENLSRILPGQVWLSQMSAQGGNIRLTGYAPDPPAVIELLEKSGAFRNAQFRSPIVRRNDGSPDRFELSVERSPQVKP